MVCSCRGGCWPKSAVQGELLPAVSSMGSQRALGTSSAVTLTLDGPYDKPDKLSHMGSMHLTGSVCCSEKESTSTATRAGFVFHLEPDVYHKSHLTEVAARTARCLPLTTGCSEVCGFVSPSV